MFGQDLSKLSRKELQTGLKNAVLLNESAMEFFFSQLPDVERIHQKGPLIHSDNVLIKHMIDFTMRCMIQRELETRLNMKVSKTN